MAYNEWVMKIKWSKAIVSKKLNLTCQDLVLRRGAKNISQNQSEKQKENFY